MSKNTIQLDNFAEWQGQVKGVEISSRIMLPEYVPTHEMSVDLGKIATIASLGRLQSLHINLYEEKQQTNLSVSNIDAQGTATAGAAKAGTINRAQSSINSNHDRPLKFPRGDGVVRINVNHPDLDDKVLRSPKPWADLLDKGVRDGLATAGRKQLLEPKKERRYAFGVHKMIEVGMGATIAWATKEPSLLPFYLGVRSFDSLTGFSAVLYRTNRLDMVYDERSAFLNLPIDRYFAVKALASTQKIVTVA